MPFDALAIAPVILAVVLVASAVGKLRSPRSSAEAFRDLRVPAPLAGPAVVRALPWVEIALAGLLLLAGGWLGVLAALGALGLFAAYLGLVVRALGFEQPVDCACFGEFAPGRITRRTVLRNAWLLALSLLGAALSFDGLSPVARLAAGSGSWAWLAGAAAAAVTTYLIEGHRPADQGAVVATTAGGDDLEDYIRTRTPAVPVTLADGSTTDLRQLSTQRAQLLLYVSETCGSCAEVIAAAPGWRQRLPEIDVRLLIALEPGASGLRSLEEPMTAHDPERRVKESFGMSGSPSAVLLGADGLLAGGPVTGSPTIQEFVAEVAEALEAARAVD